MNIGDQLISAQFAANPSNSGAQTYTPTQYDETTALAIISDLAKRVSDLEGAIQLQVSSDTVISQILLTKDAALITADKVAIVGQTTFLDWHRNISGQASTGIDPSVTQIIGGVIRTGQIQNLSGASYMNLDATTTGQTFIQCASALSIFADGQFTFGNSISGKQLKYDLTNLTLGGNALLGSSATPVDTVVTGANNGTTAISTKLNKAASDILTGAITVNTSGGISVGSITWDSSGNLTGGSGVAMTAQGIVAAQAGVATMTLPISGSPTFAGNITGGSNIGITGTATFNGSTSSSSGTFSVVANPSEISAGGLVAYSNSATAPAIMAVQNGSSPAITSEGRVSVTGAVEATALVQGSYLVATAATGIAPVQVSSATLCTNLNAQIWNGLVNTGTFTATAGTLGGYIVTTYGASTFKVPYYNP